MAIRTLQKAFSGGEVTPELFGRVDDVKYQAGLAKCRNFITKPQGPAENRAGTRFVREVKDSTKRVRLLPFTYSSDQTMVIELGAGYFRFHTEGATLLDMGAVYEIANPYAEADLFDIHYVQSADVMTLVHPGYEPRELRRLSANHWELIVISLTPVIFAPAAPTVTQAGSTAVKYTYDYVVTSVSDEGESAASAVGSIGSNLFETGCTVTIAWGAVSGAKRYNVYKLQGGLYGYIGQSTSTSIVDDNISPDMFKTPPIYDEVFGVAGSIVSVPVTAGGSLYNTSIGGVITGVTMQSGATYDVAPTSVSVVDRAGTGSGATVSVTWAHIIAGYRITAISVTAGGSGYGDPVLVMSGGTLQSGVFKFAWTITPLTRTKLEVTDAGGGTGASLSAVIVAGVITGVVVENPGRGYVSPVVSVSVAGGGSGATFGTPVTTTTGDYPAAVSYFEQRRCFAGTPLNPQSIWMSKSGTESNMSYSLPIRDDDRIKFRVAAREASLIRHIVPLSGLILLTSSAEWRVTSVNSDAITPSSIAVRPQSYVGASNVQPAIVNNTMLYCAERGGHVRELGYQQDAGGFVTGDLCLRAPHLFDGFTIVDMTFAKAPQQIAWFISSNGTLLGLTYVPEQQVGAWHWHDTDGVFESCATVAEGNEDMLYVVVRRTINGASVRYIERLESRQFGAQEDAFFVDCGLTYDGAPTASITGLDHLEGKTVNILADGAVHPQRTVTAGAITLDEAASVVQIGLPITADLQTLPIAAPLKDGSFGSSHVKNVNKVWLRVYRSSGIFVGPDFDRLREVKQRTVEPYGSPPALKTEEMSINLTGSWTDGGQICVRQSDPLPLTVVCLTAEVELGG